MSFDFNTYQQQFPVVETGGLTYRPPMPRIVCADGFSLSVQAGAMAYSTPRQDGLLQYDAVEVGFPSARVPELLAYAEDLEEPTQTIYPYVPVDLVNAIILSHGGVTQTAAAAREALHRLLYLHTTDTFTPHELLPLE